MKIYPENAHSFRQILACHRGESRHMKQYPPRRFIWVRKLKKSTNWTLRELYLFVLFLQDLLLRKKRIPEAERSQAWVCSRSPAGIAGSNAAGGMDVCLL